MKKKKTKNSNTKNNLNNKYLKIQKLLNQFTNNVWHHFVFWFDCFIKRWSIVRILYGESECGLFERVKLRVRRRVGNHSSRVLRCFPLAILSCLFVVTRVTWAFGLLPTHLYPTTDERGRRRSHFCNFKYAALDMRVVDRTECYRNRIGLALSWASVKKEETILDSKNAVENVKKLQKF